MPSIFLLTEVYINVHCTLYIVPGTTEYFLDKTGISNLQDGKKGASWRNAANCKK